MAKRPTKSAMAKARMGRKPVPENESRHERFVRIGDKRMTQVIRQIQLLGNLCSPNYECDGEDLALMRSTVLRELDLALSRFSPKKRSEVERFSFADKAGKGANASTQH